MDLSIGFGTYPQKYITHGYFAPLDLVLARIVVNARKRCLIFSIKRLDNVHVVNWYEVLGGGLSAQALAQGQTVTGPSEQLCESQ